MDGVRMEGNSLVWLGQHGERRMLVEGASRRAVAGRQLAGIHGTEAGSAKLASYKLEAFIQELEMRAISVSGRL